MNNNLKQRWINALLSGDFNQGIGAMCKHNGYVGEDNYTAYYTPIGVLIETVYGEGIWQDSSDDHDTLEPKGQNGSLLPSKKFLNKVGLSKRDAEWIESFNDEGARFDEIVEFLEQDI